MVRNGKGETMKVIYEIAFEWGVRCFGLEHMLNPQVRAIRLLEEAIETAQALNVPIAQALRAVEVVYSRPVGNGYQEIGGTMMTAAILAKSLGYDPDDVVISEIKRVLALPPEHFKKRNKEKISLGLIGV